VCFQDFPNFTIDLGGVPRCSVNPARSFLFALQMRLSQKTDGLQNRLQRIAEIMGFARSLTITSSGSLLESSI
jgi:hypothetical protein